MSGLLSCVFQFVLTTNITTATTTTVFCCIVFHLDVSKQNQEHIFNFLLSIGRATNHFPLPVMNRTIIYLIILTEKSDERRTQEKRETTATAASYTRSVGKLLFFWPLRQRKKRENCVSSVTLWCPPLGSSPQPARPTDLPV